MSFQSKKGLKVEKCVFKCFELDFGWINPLHPMYNGMDKSHSTKTRFEWNYVVAHDRVF
jgi:hypothetical protein